MATFAKSVVVFYMLVTGLVVAFVVANWSVYGATPFGAALYLGGPSAGFLASLFILLRVAEGSRLVFVIVTLAALASAYLFEAYIYFSQEAGIGSNVTRPTAAALLARADPIYLPVSPVDLSQAVPMPDSGKVFPLGGVPLVRTAVWVDRSIDPDIFVADRYGFRNPDNVWDMDNIRLAAVGDSFTFGAESSTENSFVGRLRAHEPATINMGRGGNGPLAELATIREYLRAKKPQTVLWFYYQNDLQQDLFWELNTPVISEYLDPEFSQDLVSRSGAVGSALRQEYERKVGQPETAIALPDESLDRGWLQSLRFFTGANPLNRIDGLTLRRTRTVLGLVRGGGDWPDPPQAEMTEILDEAAAVTAEWGGRLLFVYLPGWREVINHDTSKEGFRTAALGAARDAQIPILDLFDVFVEHQDPKSLWPDRRPGHYGQDGNALVAVEVERWLRELGLWQ